MENSSFESCWEEGLYSVSTGCPLMGYPCQDPREEGSPAGRSSDLVESVSRSPEMVAPETLQILANVSRFETAPSDACSSPLFSIFGRPLLIGGSSSLGDFQGHEALGEVEPLRAASVDGTEWGKGTADALMEVDQAIVGFGPMRVEPSNARPECLGYNNWEDSCLIKFSEFLGIPTVGFEKDILELLRKMES